MGNYTAHARFAGRTALTLLATAVLCACAGRSQPPPAPAAPAPVVEAPAPAEKPPANPVRESAALTYTVKRGDTLWDIADYFLKDPWLWPEIWYENPDIRNPHLIFPGDIIELSYVNGRPRLQVGERGARLSPRVRATPLEQAIPTIPFDAIRDFLRGPRVVDQAALAAAPYVLAFGDRHIIGANDSTVYVRRWGASDPRELAVLHPGRVYHDPDTGEILGYEAIYVADAKIEGKGDPVAAVLSDNRQEVRIGDRLLPHQDRVLDTNFSPRAPDVPVAGHIIAVFNGVSQIARFQIVTLDRGGRDGIQRGDILTVMQAGEMVEDPFTEKLVKLPEREAGLVMVFDVYERLSYALVMKAERPMHVLDGVRSPGTALAEMTD